MKKEGILSLTVRRPVLTSVIFLIIIILGGIALSRLTIDLMPDISYPTVTIIANYPNTSPEDIENIITIPIEDAVSGIQGIELITSNSVEGRSVIRLSFTWGTDVTEAVNDIRDRLDRIMGRFPDDMERPTIRRLDLSQFPIMMLGVTGEMDKNRLYTFVDNNVKYRLERIDGVAAIDVQGGVQKEIHVLIKKEILEAYNLTPSVVANALRAENRNIPIGAVREHGRDILLRSPGEFVTIEDIQNIPIALKNGATIHIKNIATVFEATAEETQSIRVNGERGIVISLNKQSGANTVAVARGVRSEIETLHEDYPRVSIFPITDTATFIESAINNIGFSLIIGALLAFVILFLFLGNIFSTLVISIAVPISLMGTFLLMYIAGFTLNLMTFGGLALGIGMLLDNSIVVLENIFRHNEKAVERKRASILGVSEVAAPLIASTLTTIVVFLPVLFMGDISGIMFRQFAVIVGFSLLCSLFVALFLVPMLSSKMIRISLSLKSGSGGAKRVGEFLKKIELQYSTFLHKQLETPWKIVGVVAVAVIVSLWLLSKVGSDFMPAADEGEVRVSVDVDVGTPLKEFEAKIQEIEKIIDKNVPEASYTFTRVGGGGWIGSTAGTNSSTIRIFLKDERERSNEDIVRDLGKTLSAVAGAEIRVTPGRGLFILRHGAPSGDRIGIEVRGRDIEAGYKIATQILQSVEIVEGVTNARLSRDEGVSEQVIRVDRQKAYQMGITVSQMATFLEQIIQGHHATTLRVGGEDFPVVVKTNERDSVNISDILNFTVASSTGEFIPLRNFANIEMREGPSAIERQNRERIISVSADYTGRDGGSVIADIREGLSQISVPPDLSVVITGDYEEKQESFRALLIAIILAIILVYLVMAGQFESLKHPFIVLFSIPGAIVGVAVILILTETLITMQAMIGMIMLTGIVVNNAIILVDYSNRLKREEGLLGFDAIVTSGQRRLRPILMTALTTVLALIPLSFGIGDGGETQAPMARVVIGGLVSSTFITLFLIPSIYVILEKRVKKGVEV